MINKIKFYICQAVRRFEDKAVTTISFYLQKPNTLNPRLFPLQINWYDLLSYDSVLAFFI